MFQNAFLKSAALEPPPHDLDCCLDHAAFRTQEGRSDGFDTSMVLTAIHGSPRQERLLRLLYPRAILVECAAYSDTLDLAIPFH